MEDNETKRISRLMAIFSQLHIRKVVTSTMLAEKFGVSTRTIYRDMQALQQAGVPVLAGEGKGFALMAGYKMPPVMFTESEANALVTAEQLVLKNRDSSLIDEYTKATNKVKAVLGHSAKEKIELLANRIAVSPAISDVNTSDSLTLIQSALTAFKVLNISYRSEYKNQNTERNVEPFALYYSLQESWALIAYCRLRNDYRMFRLDRISKIAQLDIDFTPHKLTLKDYLDQKAKNFKHQ